MADIKIPDYWTPEQAAVVFEFVDDIREAILARYQLEIMEHLRAERCSEYYPDNLPINDEDVPF